MTNGLNLCVGEMIVVRSKEEILRTLDKSGRLEGLPFMPEMFAFCDRRLRVYKRAHKTCDTINSESRDKGRKMHDAVHLEDIRCDGRSHGGCEAACLIFWKEAWLRRVPLDERSNHEVSFQNASLPGTGEACCTESDVIAAARISGNDGGKDPVYACQTTLLTAATEPLSPWNLRQYVEDYTSGNVGLGTIVQGFIYMGYNSLVNAGIGLGRVLRWLYDASAHLRSGLPYPRRAGEIPVGEQTPTAKLGLQPGDLVRVKPYREILATLDQANKNRGLYFDAELVPFCGGTYRVLQKVTRIVDEKTGVIREFKNPCFILDGVACQSRYSECRLFCPRSIYSYWREIWLERAPEARSISAKLTPKNRRPQEPIEKTLSNEIPGSPPAVLKEKPTAMRALGGQ